MASLSSGLLARKGTARPAMRPQGFHGYGATGTIDDLGWNDMGAETAPRPAAAIQPPSIPVPLPPVLIEREELKLEVEAPRAEAEAPKPVTPRRAARIARETVSKNPKAAFTLRLDADRHLRLRLASAVTNRSAQHLVTTALDAFLQTLPEVEQLVVQLPRSAR
jgi:hypothetical protein